MTTYRTREVRFVITMEHDTVPAVHCVYFHCGETASIKITGGCVHEHVMTCHVCTHHSLLAQRVQANGRLLCHTCTYLAGNDAHDCQVSFIAITELETA